MNTLKVPAYCRDQEQSAHGTRGISQKRIGGNRLFPCDSVAFRGPFFSSAPRSESGIHP